MVTIKVFVEGGGSGKDLPTRCRKAFRTFFEKAGVNGQRLSVKSCGTRKNAYDDFCIEFNKSASDVIPILLVDSEDEVTKSAWQHLRERTKDQWAKPKNAADDQAHLMVQCMESWFLADQEQLKKYFGQSFHENALPKQKNVEAIPQAKVFESLKAATRETQKGSYNKGSHSFAILEQIDPAKVRHASPFAKRLIDTVKDKSNG